MAAQKLPCSTVLFHALERLEHQQPDEAVDRVMEYVSTHVNTRHLRLSKVEDNLRRAALSGHRESFESVARDALRQTRRAA
jgi:hypothetical protein